MPALGDEGGGRRGRTGLNDALDNGVLKADVNEG